MADYSSSSDMDQKLLIPPKPEKNIAKVKKDKPLLNQFEIFTQRDQILISTIKTTQLLSQIKYAKKQRDNANVIDDQISKLDPTKFVDDIIAENRRLKKINQWLPSEETLEKLRQEEKITEQQLGQLIGKSMTQFEAEQVVTIEDKEVDGMSPLGARILQGKMPLSEIQSITKDRQADLNAIDLGDDVVNYSKVYQTQDQYAQYLPQYEQQQEVNLKQKVQQQVVEQIMSGLPASLLVQLNISLIRQTLFYTTFIQFSDLENVVKVVVSGENDLNQYLLNKQFHQSDFYQSVYLNYPNHRPAKNFIDIQSNFNITYSMQAEQIIENIDNFETTIQPQDIFTNEYLSQFSLQYGQLFEKRLQQCEQDLYIHRQYQIDSVNQILKRDYQFEQQANKQASLQEKQILKMGGAKQTQLVRELELLSRVNDLESFQKKIGNGQFLLDFYLGAENQILAESAVDILATLTLFTHPNENLDWANNEILDDFLVEQEIELVSEPPDPIQSNEFFEQYITEQLQTGHTIQSEELKILFEALKTDINEQMVVFEEVYNSHESINRIISSYKLLLEHQQLFNKIIQELEIMKKTHTSQNMMNIYLQNINKSIEEIYKQKAKFNLQQNIPTYVTIQTLQPDDYYKSILEKITSLKP
ncbi:hypothetical protein SS50377_23295 [Spironucleus salmonicida]|uniref:Uncharacterized protein n=1 Tax=Spironucleus salmonicida TaxID=348837 RepID=V6LSG2_9EUKA|nr:hypothetical protein SS50377_23295 [Spironucleus salmonicida]|eukprot:EST47163.1 Hypothetical protein SS50377_12674 [Spironucleus salmonicida]